MCLWKKMTINILSSKTNYTNKFSILKLRENNSFQVFNVSHTCITDDQPTFTIMENQGKSIISNVFMEKMTIHLFSSKTNHTNQIYILKLRENSPFQVFNVSHTHITNDQPTSSIMEN